MKKALCIILTMLLCASLFACDSGDTSTETTAVTTEEITLTPTENNTDTEKEEETQTEQIASTNENTLEIQEGDVPLVGCETYEGYLKLINEGTEYIPDFKVPDNFICYDDISDIGEFDKFVFLSDVRYGKYDSYMYFLKIGGYDVTLYIDEKEMETFYESDRIIPEVNSDNLTSADRSKVPNTTQGVFYFHNGIRYTYDIYGNLMSIKWYSDGFTFTLSALTDLIESGQYPLRGEQDFLSKLLNKQTAYDTAMGILDKDTAE